MNWNEWIETNKLKGRNWHEWIETNELKRMNWNEWIETNELKRMNCQKMSEPRNCLFCFFMWNRALPTVSCTFCRPLSPIEPRNRGQRDSPAATTNSHFSPKNTGFRVRRRFQVWIYAFPIAHTSLLLVLDDDAVDMMIEMMMRLPWWWDSWQWQSSVTRKFPD